MFQRGSRILACSFALFFPLALLGKSTGPLVNARKEMLVMSNRKPALLQNNPNSRNRPLEQVLAFLAQNKTNRLPYRDGRFMCTEFAVALHDRAEANGFRCALVSLTFSEGIGHALNAFQTTDHGIVYVDCTGGRNGDDEDLYDTIGYIELGKPYGRLHVDLAATWPNDYRNYEEAKKIFQNLRKLDRELDVELKAINQGAKLLEDHAPEVARSPDLQKLNAALRERVEHYNRLLEGRNRIATKFRLNYDENTSPVTRVDVFW